MERAYSPYYLFLLTFPGALPQADIVRAFGALFDSDGDCDWCRFWRVEGPIHTSLGQRPRRGKKPLRDMKGL
jgi:hypothetical protein